MNRRPKPPIRRRRIGQRLKALREAAKMNLDAASARLDMTRSSLHRIEVGETKASVHVVRSMMDLYDAYVDGLIEDVRAAAKPGWYTQYGVLDLGYVDAECEASGVHEYTCLNIPGLLQTEDYIRALFGQSRRRRTAEQLDNQVAVRMIRERRLSSEDNPLELVAVIDESALRRQVGGPEVMRTQLRHLAERAELPTVTLQVLPLDAGAHSGMDGAFILLDFPDGEPPLLYHDYVTGALHIEDEAEVREARMVFDSLRGEALSPAESVALIERLAALPDDQS